MSGSNDVREGALDWLFARIAPGRAPAATPPLPEADDPAEVAPPEVRDNDDLRRAAEWLARERRRLEAYTQAQLGRIQQEHQALVQQKYLTEQALIIRSQEVSRQEQLIVARARHAEGAEIAEALEQARRARAAAESALEARRAQLEARFDEADRLALAAERRLAELDDLEARLLHESGRRERELEQWQAQLDEVQATLEQYARELDGRRVTAARR